MFRERKVQAGSGYLALAVLLPLLLALIALFIKGIVSQSVTVILVAVFSAVVTMFLLTGLFMVEPNESRVLQLFGKYVGTVTENGLRWANPFFSKRRVSVRIRNFESGKLKVNDHDGNPVEIAAVVVWKVVDTAEALFEVDDYEHYVRVQTEAALRTMATEYPYDAHEDGQLSLRGSTSEVAERLQHQVQERLASAGVDVMEARISHLAYAPEIAGAMLQRQQASAVVAARQKIVEGAVGMVEMALDMLDEGKKVALSEQRKADMVANLLVVLCSDRGAQPIISAGTSET